MLGIDRTRRATPGRLPPSCLLLAAFYLIRTTLFVS